jgi:hypothetical protein
VKRKPPFQPIGHMSAAQGSPLDVFAGRTCTCLLCDATHTFPTDEREPSDWRAAVVNLGLGGSMMYFACPAHFPPDSDRSPAARRAYQHAYKSFLEAVRRATP